MNMQKDDNDFKDIKVSEQIDKEYSLPEWKKILLHDPLKYVEIPSHKFLDEEFIGAIRNFIQEIFIEKKKTSLVYGDFFEVSEYCNEIKKKMEEKDKAVCEELGIEALNHPENKKNNGLFGKLKRLFKKSDEDESGAE